MGNDAARTGHGISEVESTLAVPNPGPLNPIISPTYLKGNQGKPFKRSSASSTDHIRHSIEEEDQIHALKAEHYAWHCQACLGEHDVSVLTPPRSYVYLSNYRKGLLEAHHVQHLQNAGDVGANNLLILCKFHHQTLGDTLSRSTVLAALATATPAHRNFPFDLEGTKLKRTVGVIAEIKLSTDPFLARLFFTEGHAEVWKHV